MKHTALTSALRRAAALALAVVLTIPTVYASAGEQRLQTTTELVDGLTYQNTITENNTSRVESFALELEADSDAYPIILQGSGTIYSTATINKAVSYAQELGYHVLGAVNADFFSTSTGVPIGIVVEDGVYKSSSGAEPALLITDGAFSFCQFPRVSLTLTNERDGTLITPHHFNKWRNSLGGMYLLNQDFSTVSTRTSTSGWYVRMRVVRNGEEEAIPRLTVNSTLTLEVTELLQSDQPLVIGADEYILTADNVSGYLAEFQSFQVGDRITLTTTCEDEALSEAQWASGAGDLMIKDGELTDSSSWTYVKDGRAPRTALGVKQDGTLLLYAVDGRKAGYSAGLSQLDLAKELLDQGCEWAVNLDGGGSTALSVWVPGQTGSAIQNQPSDGKARGCSNYILLVTDEAGDGRADRLALKQDGLTVLTGSSLPLPQAVVLDDGLNVLEGEVTDLKAASKKDLGSIEDGVYTAKSQTGTDTLRLRSSDYGVEGTAQIHVVDTLTDLTISKAGSSGTLTSLSVKPGETVQLAVTGSYWGRTALRDWGGVIWTTEGNAGTVDENGLFTASKTGGTGSITATAGGRSQTIRITMTNVHNDVTEDHWSYTAVDYCYQNGIVGGVSATEFGRDLSIRRGDFMLMLYNALGKPTPTYKCTFTDVSSTDYYYAALSWAQSAGLASGTGNGTYSPNANITREQAFTILRQALPLLGKECPDASLTVLDQFSDKDQIADYAKGHAATLVAQGVVSGKGAGLDPKGNLTRAEMAALLYKLITYTPVQDVPTNPVDPEQPVDPETPTEPEQPEEPTLPDSAGYTLTLDQTAITLNSGESFSLTAALDPAWEGAEITWTSSTPSALTVTSDGLVTNLYTGSGACVVVVTASWNGLSASCEVYCKPAQRTGTVVNAELGLNVRSGPGSDHPVIGGLSNDARVVILSEQDGWYQVLYRNRQGQAALGYVSGDYLELSE